MIYNYNVISDITSTKVNLDRLTQEIQTSNIGQLFLDISLDGSSLSINLSTTLSSIQTTTLDSIIQTHSGDPIIVDITSSQRTLSDPFSSKTIVVNGVEKSLFKRIHGVGVLIPAGTTGFIEYTSPYTSCKFTGAEIFGCDAGDYVDFFVLDTDTNAYSGAPGGNFPLNQFGFTVYMPKSGEYANTSNYDADVYPGMTISCAYKNNGTTDKFVAMNVWLHEVK